MTTAFVLSGGASLGAIQVGMADALYDRARRGTVHWIANGEPYALPLLGHHHSR